MKNVMIMFLAVLLVNLAACGVFKGREDAKQDREQKEAAPMKMREANLKTKSEARKMAPVGMGAQPTAPMETASDEVDGFDTEEYGRIYENKFKDTGQNPLSTFSIDVDNASYSNIRRFINDNRMPPKDAVRIEEMINYFTYDYPQPEGNTPFSIFTEVSSCPWNREHRLVHIGLQGKSLNYDDMKPCNLVFLVDSSGSMSAANKLPLLKQSLKLLVDQLDDRDKISIVAYAGSAGLVLPATSASDKDRIVDALEQLNAGGATAGGQGVQLAYKTAEENLIANGNNRVILCTDGDFNVGVSSTGDLVRLIEEKRKKDIYLTICGFGMGNYKDNRMEQISNAGNGNYSISIISTKPKKSLSKRCGPTFLPLPKTLKSRWNLTR